MSAPRRVEEDRMAFLGLALLAGVIGFLMVFVACAVLALRAVIWIVLLPFRLLFAVLTLPWLLVKGVALTVGAILVLLVAIVAVVVAVVGLVVALLVPILPLVFIGLVTWALVRLMRRPAPLRPA
jgi:hypothetical protein